MTDKPQPIQLPDAAPASSPAERLHAFDALRAVAMLLGLWLHGALPYMNFVPPYWPVQTDTGLWGLDASVLLIHAFRMQLFFLVAGFFGRLVLERRGLARFAKHRGARIALPLLLGLLTIGPLTAFSFRFGWAVGDEGATLNDGFAAMTRGSWFELVAQYHLWFLAALIWFYFAAIALHAATPRGFRAGFDRLGGLLSRPWSPAIACLPVIAVLLALRKWDVGETNWIFPRADSFLYYGLFFAAGWLLWPARDRLVDAARRWWIWLLPPALLLAWPVHGVAIILAESPNGEGVGPVVGIVGTVSKAVFTTLCVAGFIGLFCRFVAKPRPWARYLADASYWMYLIHMPVQVFLAALLAKTALPGSLQFAAVLAGSVAISLVTYQLGVRYTPIGTLLNGPRRKPEPLSPTPQTL